MSFKTLISSAALIGAMAAITPAANAGDYSATLDYTSEYVFRGFGLGAESLQAGVEKSVDGMTFGVWASTGIGEESIINADEVDIYGGYSWDVKDAITADVGATLYHYPQAGNLFEVGADEAGTFEVYGGLGFDSPLAPSVYAYYDTTLEVLTLEGSASHSIAADNGLSFDFGATLGSVNPDEGDGYEYLTGSAAASYGLTDETSIYLGLNASTASEDNFYDYEGFVKNGTVDPDSSTLWWGVGLSTSL
ncbi:MAG: TorF family putative porin [Robiginitomaculum sp.]